MYPHDGRSRKTEGEKIFKSRIRRVFLKCRNKVILDAISTSIISVVCTQCQRINIYSSKKLLVIDISIGYRCANGMNR